MINSEIASHTGREQGRLVRGESGYCSKVSTGLRKLLLRDAATVIGLCLRPDVLSSTGYSAMRSLLEIHATTCPAARAALAVVNRRGVRR